MILVTYDFVNLLTLQNGLKICLQISEDIDDCDLECTECHKDYYQKFINHKPGKGTNDSQNTSKVECSPHKNSTSTLLLPECVFCEKLEMKVNERTMR